MRAVRGQGSDGETIRGPRSSGGRQAARAQLSTRLADTRDERRVVLADLGLEAAGMPDERVIAARLGEIANRAHAVGLRSPALFLSGPTVAAASVPVAVRRVFAAVG